MSVISLIVSSEPKVDDVIWIQNHRNGADVFAKRRIYAIGDSKTQKGHPVGFVIASTPLIGNLHDCKIVVKGQIVYPRTLEEELPAMKQYKNGLLSLGCGRAYVEPQLLYDI